MYQIINGMFPGELYPNRTLAGCIDVFENSWPDPKSTISALENECLSPESGLNWNRATTLGGGVNQNYRTNYDINLTNSALYSGNQVAANIHNQFYILLLASMLTYSKKYEINETFYHEDYNVLRYRGGQNYSSHYDGGTSTGRSVSAICYLNNDYVGGEIEFVNFNIKIKPEPGMLILFPSNYAYSHIAHPVTDGTKYAIVTWIRDRIL
jgi:hypothetical protein